MFCVLFPMSVMFPAPITLYPLKVRTTYNPTLFGKHKRRLKRDLCATHSIPPACFARRGTRGKGSNRQAKDLVIALRALATAVKVK